jgi:anti-sigma regulatory factor (Ser/Thr protein kinase)
VRFESTRTAVPPRFVHRAAFYPSPEHLVEIMLPMVAGALDENTPVALIASAITERRVREELGRPAGLVHLTPPPTWLCDSGQAVVSQRARELREFTEWAGQVVVVAEYNPDRPGLRPAAWVEADAAVNVALASLPVTMTCLYPAEPGADEPGAVHWNHPELVGDDGSVHANPDARPPAEVLARYPVPTPPSLGPPDSELSFTPWQLIELRAAVAEATEQVGLSRSRAQDFVLAVNEVASNAVEHGRGLRRLRMWHRPGRVICEVHDNGSLANPLPGLIPPHPNNPRGRGLWIARQLCDLLHVWSDTLGTHVRLHAGRS